jgi:hypothetical protein
MQTKVQAAQLPTADSLVAIMISHVISCSQRDSCFSTQICRDDFEERYLSVTDVCKQIKG